jgi:tetratricopeptide (TPR) repeat protein
MALKYLNKALEIDCTLDEAWVDMGIVSTQLEKIPEAITCFKKALECNSKCVRALHYLGLAYLKSGDNETALQQFDETLRVDDTLPETWLGKAIATERLHLIEEATQCIRKALELRPDYDLGWYNQSLLLNRQGRTMEALESFNQALELNPNLFKQSPMRWTIPNENSSE